jgi:hypothetical protein
MKAKRNEVIIKVIPSINNANVTAVICCFIGKNSTP